MLSQLLARSAENDDTVYTLKLKLLLDGKDYTEKTAAFDKSSKDSISLSFDGLPLGHKAKILASILADEKELASGESNEIEITPSDNIIKIKLKLEAEEPAPAPEESTEPVVEEPEEEESQEADGSGTIILHFTPGLVFSIEPDPVLYLNNGKVAVSVKDSDGTELPSENISAKLYFSGREVDSELYSFKDSVLSINSQTAVKMPGDDGEEFDELYPAALPFYGSYQLYITAENQSSTFNINVEPEYYVCWDITPEIYIDEVDGYQEEIDPSYSLIIDKITDAFPYSAKVNLVITGNPKNITYTYARDTLDNCENELKVLTELSNFLSNYKEWITVNNGLPTNKIKIIDMSAVGSNFTYLSTVYGNYSYNCEDVEKFILPPGLKIILPSSFRNPDDTTFVINSTGLWYSTEDSETFEAWVNENVTSIEADDNQSIFELTSEELQEELKVETYSKYYYRIGE